MNKAAAFILLFSIIIPILQAQSPPPVTYKVVPVHSFEDLYRYHDFYISAQPEVARLTFLKDQGIRTIVNLRTEEENEVFREEEYDEKFVAEKLGFSYIELPIENGPGFTPENQAEFNSLLDTGTPTLIHCSSGRRATYLFIAYLVQERGVPLQEAVETGKQMKYRSPLEQLLDKEIILEIATE
ncbi:MAG: sulfur transferase domain-containing protein [Bacteroidales bacterium]|nr:sulfur transferase domain-containing protein [Bacteroidales bacterium]MDT8430431.1 sulfur transferase domain-containing protein [Bacteroidales bacterium]